MQRGSFTIFSALVILAMGGSAAADVVRLDVELAAAGATLPARIYIDDAQITPLPLIVLLPGAAGDLDDVRWAANRLARDGYVAIAVQPADAASPASHHEAAVAAIDFMLSLDNPVAAMTDVASIGAAGWGVGARALSLTQEQDLRLDAIVAWDNLAVRETGDEGSPGCDFDGTLMRQPRAAAMGMASESCVDVRGPQAKKTAFEWWRLNGVDAMQVVFANSTTDWWSDLGTPAQHDLAHHYTLAWFDRHLKNDAAAIDRLLTSTPAGQSDVLSDAFISAAFLGGIDCGDLSTCLRDGSTSSTATPEPVRVVVGAQPPAVPTPRVGLQLGPAATPTPQTGDVSDGTGTDASGDEFASEQPPMTILPIGCGSAMPVMLATLVGLALARRRTAIR